MIDGDFNSWELELETRKLENPRKLEKEMKGTGGGTSIKSMQLLKKDVRDQGIHFELI